MRKLADTDLTALLLMGLFPMLGLLLTFGEAVLLELLGFDLVSMAGWLSVFIWMWGFLVAAHKGGIAIKRREWRNAVIQLQWIAILHFVASALPVPELALATIVAYDVLPLGLPWLLLTMLSYSRRDASRRLPHARFAHTYAMVV